MVFLLSSVYTNCLFLLAVTRAYLASHRVSQLGGVYQYNGLWSALCISEILQHCVGQTARQMFNVLCVTTKRENTKVITYKSAAL